MAESFIQEKKCPASILRARLGRLIFWLRRYNRQPNVQIEAALKLRWKWINAKRVEILVLNDNSFMILRNFQNLWWSMYCYLGLWFPHTWLSSISIGVLKQLQFVHLRSHHHSLFLHLHWRFFCEVRSGKSSSKSAISVNQQKIYLEVAWGIYFRG